MAVAGLKDRAVGRLEMTGLAGDFRGFQPERADLGVEMAISPGGQLESDPSQVQDRFTRSERRCAGVQALRQRCTESDHLIGTLQLYALDLLELVEDVQVDDRVVHASVGSATCCDDGSAERFASLEKDALDEILIPAAHGAESAAERDFRAFDVRHVERVLDR